LEKAREWALKAQKKSFISSEAKSLLSKIYEKLRIIYIKELEKDPSNCEYIMTKRGVGYYFSKQDK
jgi:DNA-binding response OmpR family regulator